MNSIISMSVQSTVDDIAMLYTAAVNRKVPFKELPSIMLWGAPGVGKSEAISEIAEILRAETKKRVSTVDVRLNLFNPIDLRGIPVANDEKTLAVWLKPQIFNMDSSEDVINILFLDELSAAPQSVQAAAFQITLDRMIGEHSLPENCIVIAAGNRVTDRSVAFRMPNALANRLRHIEVESDFDSWRSWAVQNRIHPLVVSFLTYNPANLHRINPDMDEVAFPTPRTWEFVSNYLWLMLGDDISGEGIKGQFSRIAGLVGVGTASEFIGYCKSVKELKNCQDILKGTVKDYPKSMDALYMLVMNLSSSIEKLEKEDTVNGIKQFMLENAVSYASKFPADYQVAFYLNLSRDEGLKKKLRNTEGFKSYFKGLKSNVLKSRLSV